MNGRLAALILALALLAAPFAAEAQTAGRATAQGQYAAATALASELEMRPLLAHCHLGLGELYRRTGKREQAQEHFVTATTM